MVQHRVSRFTPTGGIKLLFLAAVLVLLVTAVSASPNIHALRLYARQQSGTGGESPPRQAPPTPSTPSTPSAPSAPSSQPPLEQPGTSGTEIRPNGPIVSPRPSGSNSTLPPIGGSVIGTGGGGTIIGGGQVIDPRRPVSRLSIVQPKQNSASPPLFSVGSNIVFEWAFDNSTLVFPPSNITVEVNMSGNSKMVWPVANVSGSATSVVWNTAEVTNPVLFTGFYTLSIYDSKIGKQGVATSGHLMPFSDLQFGLYISGPYVPRTGAFCQSCSHGTRLTTMNNWIPWIATGIASAIAGCRLVM